MAAHAQAATRKHMWLTSMGADVDGSPMNVHLRTSLMACNKVRLCPPGVDAAQPGNPSRVMIGLRADVLTEVSDSYPESCPSDPCLPIPCHARRSASQPSSKPWP